MSKVQRVLQLQRKISNHKFTLHVLESRINSFTICIFFKKRIHDFENVLSHRIVMFHVVECFVHDEVSTVDRGVKGIPRPFTMSFHTVSSIRRTTGHESRQGTSRHPESVIWDRAPQRSKTWVHFWKQLPMFPPYLQDTCMHVRHLHAQPSRPDRSRFSHRLTQKVSKTHRTTALIWHDAMFSDHIYHSDKTVAKTRDLWIDGKMIDEKNKTCMSHKPWHTGIADVSGSESDTVDDSESEDDD